jgi:hypothetical protein
VGSLSIKNLVDCSEQRQKTCLRAWHAQEQTGVSGMFSSTKGRWLALATWNLAALHIKDRNPLPGPPLLSQ